VSGNFQLMLQAKSLEEWHTGEYMEIKIITDGVSTDQVYFMFRNNGSNIVKAMSEAGLPSYGCFAHSLQLVVHNGLLTQHIVIDLLAVLLLAVLLLICWLYCCWLYCC